jgi:porphobilinogen synthase
MNKIIIFGTQKVHDSTGSEAWNSRGFVQDIIRNIKSNFDKKLEVIADVCVCQYNL